MPVLQCTNGHVTIDRDAAQCPQCGAPIVMRRGWRQEGVLDTGYAPFPPAAQITLGGLMLGAAAVAFAMGVPLTIAVGAVLVLIGGTLVGAGVLRAVRDNPRREN